VAAMMTVVVGAIRLREFALFGELQGMFGKWLEAVAGVVEPTVESARVGSDGGGEGIGSEPGEDDVARGPVVHAMHVG
jgi:hypothetical protein